jgi:hypothetical protein
MIGSYKCECVTGFGGNGFNCTGKQADGIWTTIKFVMVDLPDLRTKREVHAFCILRFVKIYPLIRENMRKIACIELLFCKICDLTSRSSQVQVFDVKYEMKSVIRAM